MSALLNRFLIIVAGLVSGTLAAQVTTWQIPLSKLQSTSPLRAADIRQVHSISFGVAQEWYDGFVGDEKPGQLALQTIGNNAEWVSEGIMLRYRMNAGSAAVEICETRYNCRPITITPTNKSYIVPLSSGRWEIKHLGHPCKNTLECDLFIPSWSLEALRVHHNAMPPVTKVISMIHHHQGLTFVGADHGKTLLQLHFQTPTPASFKSTVLNDGTMALTSKNIGFILDWPNDRGLKIDGRGVYRSQGGLVGLNRLQLHTLAELPVNPQRVLIDVNERFVVYSDYIITWQLHNDEVRILSQKAVPEGTILTFSSQLQGQTVLVQTGKTYKLIRLEESGSWKTLTSFTYSGPGNFEVHGENIYHFGKDGLKVLVNNNMKNTSLTMRDQYVYLTDRHNAFIQKFTNNQCAWEHYVIHPKHPESLTGTGVKVNCGVFNSFSSSPNWGSTLTSFDGQTILVKHIRSHTP